MRYIFSSPYYLNERATGANKRFEKILYELQDKHQTAVVVCKGQVPLGINAKVRVYEMPSYISNSRLLTFIYLNFLYFYFLFGKNIVISDFNPIPLSLFFSKKQFQLIHDARIIDDFGRWNMLSGFFMKLQWRLVKNRIVVSEFTKSRLCDVLSVKKSSVTVSYNGVSPSEFELTPEVVEDKPFDLLYVATFEERKNHTNLIKALSLIEQPLNVIFLGKDLGLKERLVNEANTIDQHNITFKDSVTELELGQLYRDSKIFISPSLYEGFGMPILEAYGYGCKVLCSDISVFHEVLADKATYFAPESPKHISDVISSSLITLENTQVSSSVIPAKFLWNNISERLIEDTTNISGHINI
jgi:glycosyltransferase involved in cell wall biosynthesis